MCFTFMIFYTSNSIVICPSIFPMYISFMRYRIYTCMIHRYIIDYLTIKWDNMNKFRGKKRIYMKNNNEFGE